MKIWKAEIGWKSLSCPLNLCSHGQGQEMRVLAPAGLQGLFSRPLAAKRLFWWRRKFCILHCSHDHMFLNSAVSEVASKVAAPLVGQICCGEVSFL